MLTKTDENGMLYIGSDLMDGKSVKTKAFKAAFPHTVPILAGFLFFWVRPMEYLCGQRDSALYIP